MKKEIVIKTLDWNGGWFTVNGLIRMADARREARRIYESLGEMATVEVILDGCVKKMYGSLQTRRTFQNYQPSSVALNGKS